MVGSTMIGQDLIEDHGYFLFTSTICQECITERFLTFETGYTGYDFDGSRIHNHLAGV